MREDFNLYTNGNGAFVPQWLLSRAEIGAGAKLTYARLAQLVDEDDSVLVCFAGLATDLGVTEFQATGFILQLKEYGLISMNGFVTGKDHFWCGICEPPESQAKHLVRRGSGFGKRKRALSHGGRSGNALGEKQKGGSDGGLSYQPLSRYDFETCLAYAKRCKEEGEPIESVYALARYLHRTGAQDEMIALVRGLCSEEESCKAEPPNIPLFESNTDTDTPSEIQDETGLDQ